MRIALDVMGGDYGPAEVIAGAMLCQDIEGLSLILVGDQEVIKKELSDYQYPESFINIVHASEVINMDESPAIALRKKRDASITVATTLVKQGVADAVLSCGSTGAQMAAAVFILGRLNKIERPPLVAAVPSLSGNPSLLIDVGANVDCKPAQLVQFALLGKVYAKIVLGLDNPRIALLNNGTEEGKGNSLTSETYQLLKKNDKLNFVGNIEGREIFNSQADVIVCDGFTGNVLLKTIEGLAMTLAKSCLAETGKLPSVFSHLDYSKVGGAPLLGVNGVSIVCHGSSRRQAVSSGIRTAVSCVQNQIIPMLKEALGSEG